MTAPDPRPDMGEIDMPAEHSRTGTVVLVILGVVHLIGEGVWRSLRAFRRWRYEDDGLNPPKLRWCRYTGRAQMWGKGGWTDVR